MPARPAASPDLPSDPDGGRPDPPRRDTFERAGLAYGHGTDDAVDDAAALVFHALDLDHAQAESAYRSEAGGAAGVARVLALFDERVERRVPAAYLMGRMWFAGLEFEVDSRVIVPRSPFAELIHARLRAVDRPGPRATHPRHRHRLGLHRDRVRGRLAARRRSTRSTFRRRHSRSRRRNVARHGVGDRVQLFQGDVFEPVADARYDLIVANPPYVSDAEMQALPPEYLHEPDLALRAGTDGLDVVRRILAGVPRHLEPDGALFVEVGDSDERVQHAFPGAAAHLARVRARRRRRVPAQGSQARS